ncbi:MAG: porin family protein [Alphaproteobacteria bacterium]|nr:porin family protein [Alphaproteobacteria bacterium]
MRILIGISAALVIGLASPASADPAIWDGFYIGANAGYGWQDSEFVMEEGGAWSTVDPQIQSVIADGGTGDMDADGILGGIHGGFNFAFDRWVAGFEADISFTSLEDTRTEGPLTEPVNNLDFTFRQDIKTTYLATLRPRFGLSIKQTLFFVTGGLAVAEVEVGSAITGQLDPMATGPDYTSYGSTTDTLFGWTIGAGFEEMFAPNWSFKAEYNYYDFEDATFSSNSTAAAYPGYSESVDVDLDMHVVRAGISYHFN